MKIEEIEIPGKLSTEEAYLRNVFLEQIDVIPGGEKIKGCIQCGTCTGSCPVSYAMDVSPRELIALFRAGDISSILESRTIWVCASCYTCQSRCPASIKITDVIYALKRTAMEKGIYGKRFAIHALSASFIKSMKVFGRLNEPRLMIYYFIKTGIWRSIAYLPLGVRMMKKGRLDYRASKIKDIKGFRRIINKAQEFDLPVVKENKGYIKNAVGYKAVG